MFTLLSCVAMSAQDGKYKSRVELKSGKAEIVGYVAKQDDGGYVVETESGDVFYYSESEIKKITPLNVLKESKTKEPKVKEAKTKESKENIIKEVSSYESGADRSKTKGYMGIIESGIGLDSYAYNEDYSQTAYTEANFGMSLSIINGYRFSRHFYIGAGIGFDNPCTGVTIPMYLHLRAETSKKKLSPYIGLSGGLALSTYSGLGPYLDGSVGLRSHCKKHGSMWYGLSVSALSIDGGPYFEDYITVKLKIAYSF